MKVAVIGGGWAGLACAVRATEAGHAVTVFEATRQWGGRARRLDTDEGPLDNGQHILIGAYSASLALMRTVGVDPDTALLRLPLTLRFPDGSGLVLPPGRSPTLALLVGIANARGWRWRDKAALLARALRWRLAGFTCPPQASVADLCHGLPAPVWHQLIEPLCVSALNTPPHQASGSVFLRVMRDALLGDAGSADLLLPRVDLGRLLPDAATAWLARHGAELVDGRRVRALHCRAPDGWRVDNVDFDAVVLAAPPWETTRLLREATGIDAAATGPWLARAEALRHEGIGTVYVEGAPALTAAPMLALHSSPEAPAQFVFDRGQLGSPAGLAAFIVSAAPASAGELEAQVLEQARRQLGWTALRPLRTIVERRATFACVPGLQRPPMRIVEGLWACGDYVDGPYPATLEGAARCAEQVAHALGKK